MRPPLPPFDEETAVQKVLVAEDGWNTRDPERVAQACTEDSVWRNRDEIFSGREAIIELLRRGPRSPRTTGSWCCRSPEVVGRCLDVQVSSGHGSR